MSNLNSGSAQSRIKFHADDDVVIKFAHKQGHTANMMTAKKNIPAIMSWIEKINGKFISLKSCPKP